MNGWDQSRPLSSHGPYGLERPPPSPGLEPAQTSHCPSSTGICSACNSALCQMSLLSPSASSPSFFDAGTEFDPSTPSCLIDLSTSCPVTPGEAPLSLSPYTGANFAQSNLCDPVNYQPQSQPSNLYYVATGRHPANWNKTNIQIINKSRILSPIYNPSPKHQPMPSPSHRLDPTRPKPKLPVFFLGPGARTRTRPWSPLQPCRGDRAHEPQCVHVPCSRNGSWVVGVGSWAGGIWADLSAA